MCTGTIKNSTGDLEECPTECNGTSDIPNAGHICMWYIICIDSHDGSKEVIQSLMPPDNRGSVHDQ